MPVPHGHWKTTTFVAALRADGLTAPMVVDGAINGDLFVAYVRAVLVPTLRPGDVVVMDNLSSHKRAGVREAIEAAGCRLLYLPPYSPDLNPIEQAFAKLKALLRKAGERTVEGLWRLLGRLARRVHAPRSAATTSRIPDTAPHRIPDAVLHLLGNHSSGLTRKFSGGCESRVEVGELAGGRRRPGSSSRSAPRPAFRSASQAATSRRQRLLARRSGGPGTAGSARSARTPPCSASWRASA